jgi:hypothetical protein
MAAQELIQAVDDADLNQVALLLKKIDPNLQDMSGRTALHADVLRDDDNTAITTLLLKAGADPNLSCLHGSSPIYNAVLFLKINQARQMLLHAGNLHAHPPDQARPTEVISQLAQAAEQRIAYLESHRQQILSLGALASDQLPESGPRAAFPALPHDAALPLARLANANKPAALANELKKIPEKKRAAYATDALNMTSDDTPLACIAHLLEAGGDPNITTPSANSDRRPPIHVAALSREFDRQRLDLMLKHNGNINTPHPDTRQTILDTLNSQLTESRQQADNCKAFAALLEKHPDPNPASPAQAIPEPQYELNIPLQNIDTRRGAFHMEYAHVCQAVMLVEGTPRQILDALETAGLIDTSGPYPVENPPLLPIRAKALIALKGHSWSFFINAAGIPYPTHARSISKTARTRTVLVGYDNETGTDYARVFDAGKQVESAQVSHTTRKCRSTLRKVKLTTMTTSQEYFNDLLIFLDAMTAPAVIYQPHHGPPVGPFNQATVAESLWLLPNEDALEP